MAAVNVSELAILAANQGRASAEVSELVALVAIADPPTRYIDTSEVVALVAYEKAEPVTQVSELVMLVTYVSTPPETYNSRAWGFTLDNHNFYVLHLGQEGTFVFDQEAQQWYQWQTEGYNNWNMENGIEWNDQVYAGDSVGPTLWRLDPDGFLDEDFKLIRRIVTGGIPAVARQSISTGMFVLSISPEGPLDDQSDPYVQLEISDDDGKTFRSLGSILLNGDETQDLSWRGLGTIKYPGRIYRITDEGGVVRINGADQTTRGENKGRG